MSREKQYKRRKPAFLINDHGDILMEVLKRLDGRSLCAAACVCRLWRTLASSDSIWEHLCLRRVGASSSLHLHPHSSHGFQAVVSALGGYRRLYMICIRHILTRRADHDIEVHGQRITSTSTSTSTSGWDELQLSLSLYCIDWYERLGGRFGFGVGGDTAGSSSLMFLSVKVGDQRRSDVWFGAD